MIEAIFSYGLGFFCCWMAVKRAWRQREKENNNALMNMIDANLQQKGQIEKLYAENISMRRVIGIMEDGGEVIIKFGDEE